ncbi:MAG: hypothetical protein M1813_001978 [Trichoglossum hirsutum]|nr:MAG: hypothetical protein M1813_001978 [Trichoglossum hirsutum]
MVSSVGAFFGGLGRVIGFATSWIFCFPCMLCLLVRSHGEKHKARRREDLEALSIQRTAVPQTVGPARRWPAQQTYSPLNQVEFPGSSLSFPAESNIEPTPPRYGRVLSKSGRLWRKGSLSSKRTYTGSTLSCDANTLEVVASREMVLEGWGPQEEGREIDLEPSGGIESTLGQSPDLVDFPVAPMMLGMSGGGHPPPPSHNLLPGRLVTWPPLISTLEGKLEAIADEPGAEQYGDGITQDDGSWLTDAINQLPDAGPERGPGLPDVVVEFQEPIPMPPEDPHMPPGISMPTDFAGGDEFLYSVPSLTPSSTGGSPLNVLITQPTSPQTTDAYSSPGFYHSPRPEKSDVDMDNTHDAYSTGVSTESSPASVPPNGYHSGHPFACPVCPKSFGRKCDLKYESA